MKKTFLGILIGFILVLLRYVGMSFNYTLEMMPHTLARVAIKNESGQHVKKVLLRHNRGSIEATNIRNKDLVLFQFSNTNENSYTLSVTYSNDSILITQPNYFEHGYRGTETITAGGIISSNNW
ncbi:MAG: hypothetical protein IPM69_05295 [Ignavibacteria bacterium]|nr:hypothetical protein [Ignavibacteria bacterium]